MTGSQLTLNPYRWVLDLTCCSEAPRSSFPCSWNSNFTILYRALLLFAFDRFHLTSFSTVDQPVGSGFSYATNQKDYEKNETIIAKTVWQFLQQFFALHPQYANLPFFLFGESYGKLVSRTIKTAHLIPPQAGTMSRPSPPTSCRPMPTRWATRSTSKELALVIFFPSPPPHPSKIPPIRRRSGGSF